MRQAKDLSFCLVALVGLSIFFGCSSTSNPPVAAVRSYNGTASVGDFLTISIDSTAGTITYHDLTNGESGVVPFAVNADGTYTITDPQGNLLAAYEVPGFILLVESAKAGPNRNTPALITAIENTPASIDNFKGRNFNYMMFRTSDGGIEIGTVTIDAQGNIPHESYTPAAILWGSQGQYFNASTFPASSVTEDPSGDFFTITAPDASNAVVFGTQNGLWAGDLTVGAILGLPKASAKAFDPSDAGTYTAIFYEKLGAQTVGNFGSRVETGTPRQGKATVTVTPAGTVTIADALGNTLASGTLVAVADVPYIYDGTSNTFSDPCWGLFTVRTSSATSQQDLFVSFQGNAVIFSSFQTALPAQSSNTYTYFYGLGLR